jgi:Spy/CpxP family protein refolding chaperone
MTGRQTFRIAASLVVGAALMVATAGTGHAQDWGSHGRGHDGGPLLGIPLRALNLTPDQQTQVRSILSSSFATMRPLMQQLRQAETALGDAMLAAPGADVSAQLATINGLRSQLLHARTQATAQVLAVLNPDQLAKATQVRAQLGQLRAQLRQLMAPAQP